MSLFSNYNYRSRLLRILAGICLGGWVVLPAWALAVSQGPKLVLPETSYNFGEVFEDQPLSHTFEVKNLGDADLVITDIDPDCACTLADYDRRIPPGQRGRINLTIKPFSVVHEFCKKTKIFTNDPSHRVAVIQVYGHAKPFIEIRPRHIIRFRGDPAEPHAACIRLISNQLMPLAITGYETDIPDKISVAIETITPGKVFEVKVSNKCRRIGGYKGKIFLKTTSDKRPRLILRVFADLFPTSAASP